ncbi:MAG: glycosyltransferase family 25 protein, partial [Bacteroidota bacterium]
MSILKTYVIHVSDDHLRADHIEREFKGKISDYEFVNEGDISDLNDDILQQFFHVSLHGMNKPNEVSCTYKHLLTYQKVLNNTENSCLILEDDIVLYPNFLGETAAILEEVKSRKLQNFIISLEDSTNQFIKRSERIKKQLLYPKERG